MATKISTLTPENCAITKNSIQTNGKRPIVQGGKVLYIPVFGKSNNIDVTTTSVPFDGNTVSAPINCAWTSVTMTKNGNNYVGNLSHDTDASKRTLATVIAIRQTTDNYKNNNGAKNQEFRIGIECGKEWRETIYIQQGSKAVYLQMQYSRIYLIGDRKDAYTSTVTFSNNFLAKKDDYLILMFYRDFARYYQTLDDGSTLDLGPTRYVVARAKDGNNMYTKCTNLSQYDYYSETSGFVQQIKQATWGHALPISGCLSKLEWKQANTYALPANFSDIPF